MLNYRKKKILVVIIGLIIIILACFVPVKNDYTKEEQQEKVTESHKDKDLVIVANELNVVSSKNVSLDLLYECEMQSYNQESEERNSYEESEESVVETTEESVEFTEEEQVVAVLSSFKIPTYSVNGVHLAEDLNFYLYQKLEEKGITWWHTLALCQAYQESKFNIYAEAKNGLDKGLFQFRKTFWAGLCNQYLGYVADIFDPYAQIDVYVGMVSARINKGLTQSQIISAHYTGGYGYSQNYVDQVMQWANYIIPD